MSQVLQKPPQTWAKYLDSGDYWGIVNMEFTEAKSALKNFNATPNHNKKTDAMKELTHAAAALLTMREHIAKNTHNKDDKQ